MRIGRYLLGPVLGTGGGGRVHRATLLGPGGLERAVALKVLDAGGPSLLREARIGGLLRHRHLVDVYEIGEEDGQWFCAMELCAGGTVGDHLPLSSRAAVEVAVAVCDALQYAHEELGLVHLDLKPDNLLLTEQGVVKVADLGISRAVGFDDDGRVRGTPYYMAPEQKSGKALGPTADVYALGVTLVELVTGVRPGGTETLDLELDRPVTEERVPIPQWLEPVVERCLSRDPTERWPSMAALAAAMRALPVEGPGLHLTLGVLPEAMHEASDVLVPGDGLLGREEEVGALQEMWTAPGLITVKGPVGVGKSRLVQAATPAWSGRVWSCDVANVVDVAGLELEVATCLGLKRTVDLEPLLADLGPVLLILDNLEKLLPLGSVLCSWCEAAPEIRIVVTSPWSLNRSPERVLQVAPLSAHDSASLLRRLARERGVDIGDDPAVSSLCAQLDGLPLAIELAAGRLGVLSVEDVLQRLRAGILRSARTGRHATLDAALRWSWDQVGADGQEALAQLSSFQGGFTVVAAESVLKGVVVLDVLDVLVNCSLVQSVLGRLNMPHSVRRFLHAQRGPPPRSALVRHGVYFRGFGTVEAIEGLFLHGGFRGRHSLVAERPNLLVACQRAIERGDGDVAVDLLAACWYAISRSGPVPLAIDLVERVLPMELSAASRARGLGLAGIIYRAGGALDRAHSCLAEAHQIFEALGMQRGVLSVLCNTASLSYRMGRTEDTAGLCKTALDFARELGDGRRQCGMLNLSGLVALELESPEARAHLEAAQALNHALGDRLGETAAMGNLAWLARKEGRLHEATERYEQTLVVKRELQDSFGVALVLINLGHLWRQRGDCSQARVCLLEALEIGEKVRDTFLVPNVLVALGQVHLAAHAPDEAADVFRRAVEASGDMPSRVRGWACAYLARCLELEEAGPWIERAQSDLRGLGSESEMAIVYAVHAGLLLRAGRTERGLTELTEAERCVLPRNADVLVLLAWARAALPLD